MFHILSERKKQTEETEKKSSTNQQWHNKN